LNDSKANDWQLAVLHAVIAHCRLLKKRIFDIEHAEICPFKV